MLEVTYSATEYNAMNRKRSTMLTLLIPLVTIAPSAHASGCDVLRSSSRFATRLAGTALAGAGTAMKAAGISAVTHSSGSLILSTASSGYLAGTLGPVASAAAAISGPIGLAAGLSLLTFASYCEMNERLQPNE